MVTADVVPDIVSLDGEILSLDDQPVAFVVLDGVSNNYRAVGIRAIQRVRRTNGDTFIRVDYPIVQHVNLNAVSGTNPCRAHPIVVRERTTEIDRAVGDGDVSGSGGIHTVSRLGYFSPVCNGQTRKDRVRVHRELPRHNHAIYRIRSDNRNPRLYCVGFRIGASVHRDCVARTSCRQSSSDCGMGLSGSHSNGGPNQIRQEYKKQKKVFHVYNVNLF